MGDELDGLIAVWENPDKSLDDKLLETFSGLAQKDPQAAARARTQLASGSTLVSVLRSIWKARANMNQQKVEELMRELADEERALVEQEADTVEQSVEKTDVSS